MSEHTIEVLEGLKEYIRTDEPLIPIQEYRQGMKEGISIFADYIDTELDRLIKLEEEK